MSNFELMIMVCGAGQSFWLIKVLLFCYYKMTLTFHLIFISWYLYWVDSYLLTRELLEVGDFLLLNIMREIFGLLKRLGFSVLGNMYIIYWNKYYNINIIDKMCFFFKKCPTILFLFRYL